MVRERKGLFISKMMSMGYSNRQIAWIIYRDSTEKGQKKVRAMLSYMKKKGLCDFRTGSKQSQNLTEFFELESMVRSALKDKSFRNIIPMLRKRKTLASGLLWKMRFPVSMIAVMLYGDHSEETQNKVYAHISKFRNRVRELRSNPGYGFQVQDLRSEVVVKNFPNKTCDLEPQPQPQISNVKITTSDQTETIREVRA